MTQRHEQEWVIWTVALAGVIIVTSMLSCIAGYVLPPFLRRSPITPTPAWAPPTITTIQNVAELAAVRYLLSTEASGTHVPEDIRRSLGIREEIMLIAHGEVVAGFDLSELSSADLWVDGTRIQLHLPAPKILYVRLDSERTRVVYYAKSWLIERDLNLESRARQQAEELLRQAALEGDILSHAAEYGQLYYSDWLHQMGFTEVQVIVN